MHPPSSRGGSSTTFGADDTGAPIEGTTAGWNIAKNAPI